MKRPGAILVFLALLGVACFALARSGTVNAPDIRVVCAGRSAAGAEFTIVNRSTRSVRVENVVTIEESGGGWSGGTRQLQISGSALVIGPRTTHSVLVAWTPALPEGRWRALFTLNWNAPWERFVSWLSKQPVWKRLPPQLVNRGVNAYEFGSPWLRHPATTTTPSSPDGFSATHASALG